VSLRYVLLGLLIENSGHGYGLRKEMLHRLGHCVRIRSLTGADSRRLPSRPINLDDLD
jgi:hypothetical protein